MKKAALTFGLFSLVMVATSFTAPEKTNTSYADVRIDLGIDGDGATGGVTKKRDYHGGTVINNQASLSSVNQSLGGNKKLD